MPLDIRWIDARRVKAHEYLSWTGFRRVEFANLDDFRGWPQAFVPSCVHVSSFLHDLSGYAQRYARHTVSPSYPNDYRLA